MIFLLLTNLNKRRDDGIPRDWSHPDSDHGAPDFSNILELKKGDWVGLEILLRATGEQLDYPFFGIIFEYVLVFMGNSTITVY